MRILMISDVYFPRINGVSTSIQTFSREFEKLGHEVTLIAPDYPQPYADDPAIIRIPSRQVIFDPEDRMMKLGRITALADKLASGRYDLIHVHTPFVAHYAGVRLAKKLNLPLLITYHTLFEEYLYHYIPFLPRGLLRKAARHFSRAQCNQAESIIAPSSVIVDLLRRYGVRKTIEVIPTGIHCQRFSEGNGARFREMFAIGSERKVLLNVSRVAFEKNIGLLLQVVDRLRHDHPELCLIIAGEGPAKKSYIEQTRKLGLERHIVFVGYLDRETELLDCYHSADLFVFSSRTETQGLVLLEAMAAGLPVVSIAAMGTRDILLDCPAAAIAENDVEDFADTVARLLGAENALAKLQARTHEAVGNWDSTVMARRMLHHYQTTLQIVTTESALDSVDQQTG